MRPGLLPPMLSPAFSRAIRTPAEIHGPLSVAAYGIHVAAALVAQVHTAGAAQSDVFNPGSQRSQVSG